MSKSNISEASAVASAASVQASIHSEAPSQREEEPENVEEYVYRNPLDDHTDQALVRLVEDLQRDTKYLELETRVLVKFLSTNDPNSLEALGGFLKTAQQILDRASIASAVSKKHGVASQRNPLLTEIEASAVFTAHTGQTEKNIVRVNYNQRSDLVMREIEDAQEQLKKVQKRTYKSRSTLVAEIEELQTRSSEIRKAMKQFQEIKDSFEGTMPATKYVRFMDEWERLSRVLSDKIRLRYSSTKVQFHKISNIYHQKRIVGENLQEVDFEQLRIENVHFVERMEQKNLLLLELKKMNGKANLLLSQHKEHLQKKINGTKHLEEIIEQREEEIIKFDSEIEKADKELAEVRQEHNKLKTFLETHEAPPVMNYVRTKAKLEALRRNVKIWFRRKRLKEMTLSYCLYEARRRAKTSKIPILSGFVF